MEIKERKPIVINDTAIAKIDILVDKKGDPLKLAWHFWEDEIGIDNFPDWQKMAKEFIDQLQDEWCIGFVEALRDELIGIINRHEEVCEEIRENEK